MTQAEIANEMGMSQSGLSELCTGARICTAKTLRKAEDIVNSLRTQWAHEQMAAERDEERSAGAEAECDYRAKYEDLLERYQSLVSDYQALVKRLMER